MSVNDVNGIVSELYDMIQDAKNALFQSNKCVIERDRALDLLDEMIAILPEELKSAKTIVEARNELIAQGRKEAEMAITTAKSEADRIVAKAKSDAESMIAKAKAETDRLAKQETIYAEAQKQCKEMLDETNAKIAELKKSSNQFIDNALKQTEEGIAAALRQTESSIKAALSDVKDTRSKFNTLTGEKAVEKKSTPAFVDMDID